MPSKQFDIPELGKVTVVKSKRSKHLRLTIKHDGSVNVSIPYWTPYSVAITYASKKRDWIKQNRRSRPLLETGTKIGKAHILIFEQTNSGGLRTRIKSNEVIVRYPNEVSANSPDVQQAAIKASIRALTAQANSLLPPRLDSLAQLYGFKYKSVRIKTLKSRWGSCSNSGDIVLSCYLMQLTWKEIDYVLIHELTHTIHMSHGVDFWKLVTQNMSDAQEIKKILATRKPHVAL